MEGSCSRGWHQAAIILGAMADVTKAIVPLREYYSSGRRQKASVLRPLMLGSGGRAPEPTLVPATSCTSPIMKGALCESLAVATSTGV